MSVAVLKDSSKFWAIVNAPLFSGRENDVMDTNITEDQWLAHFESIYGACEAQDSILPPETCRDLPGLVFNKDEVEKAIKETSSKKAPGPDSVPADLYKCEPIFWARILTKVFNAVVTQGIPVSWSRSIIIPIFKKGQRGDPRCYRPISLIYSVVKILGKVILAKVTDWVNDNGVLSNLQYGFIQGRSTMDQCLNLYLLTSKYTVAKEGSMYLGFMDLTSAFDLVNRSKLWSTLLALGIDPSLVYFPADLHRYLSAAQLGSLRTVNARGTLNQIEVFAKVVSWPLYFLPFILTIWKKSLPRQVWIYRA